MEVKLKEGKLNSSLERNMIMEKDLMKVKEDLSKSLKWTASSKLLGDMSSS